jgi:hypothetical protein
MIEICAKCGREIDWCNCVEITKDGKEKPGFVSSGRVVVSVEFIEAVKELVHDRDMYDDADAKRVMALNAPIHKLRSMLDQM